MNMLNKAGDTLHVVKIQGVDLAYLTVTNDPDQTLTLINHALSQGIFTNPELQRAYDCQKQRFGLQHVVPGELVVHQFITQPGVSGYFIGHNVIREYIHSRRSLLKIANIGDWLATSAYVTETREDEGRVCIKVTELGKYYAEQGCFDSGEYPMYTLVDEAPIRHSELVETHRLPQPPIGYTQIGLDDEGSFMLMAYDNPRKPLTETQRSLATFKPVMSDELLYSSLNELALAKNVPVWYLLELLTQHKDASLHFI